ncbi:MAG: endonuclease [Acidobacteriota bacterium]|nr:endonuclease [Acidobacteriota bacterium]
MKICLLFLFTPFLAAQIPDGYYDSVDMTSKETFWQSVHDIIDDHTWFPYTDSVTDTWDILELADQDPNAPNNILDVYRNASYSKQGGGNDFYNREHVWPKSYGFPDNTVNNYPYTDCHHLMLCDGGYNSARSNKPFLNCDADCQEWATQENNGTGGGSGTYPGNSNWTTGNFAFGVWETWDARKGDVARAIFYMALRYEGGNHGVTGAMEPDLRLTDDANVIEDHRTSDNATIGYMGMLSVLLQWHEQDPVDDLERSRNDVVFSFQGNRNPFVDHPEWVACLFADQCDDMPGLPDTDRWVAHVTLSGGNFTTRVMINNTASVAGNVTLYPFDSEGNLLEAKTFDIAAGGRYNAMAEEAFDSTLVSHFAIDGDASCRVSAAYKVAPDNTGATAHVVESDLIGTRFVLNQGEREVVWDGMALVNLGDEAADIQAVALDDTGAEAARVSIETALASHAKTLSVLSSLFPDHPDAQLVIESTQPAALIFLRGSQNADTFYLYQTVPVSNPEE